MNNFLEFIQKDITAKKTLIASLPTKTKTNKKKYNATIEVIDSKYADYKISVRNYLLAKSKSFAVNDEVVNLDKINEKVTILERVKFLLNPTNNYLEKMGFDDLIYQISNYYVFNFSSLDKIINGFLDKFDLAGIKLDSDDFNYTCYVHEYMSSFLEVRKNKSENYEKVSEIFEQIYWINPEIIGHIELNFRKLIRKNARKFEAYLSKIQKEVMEQNKIKNYVDCLEKLQGVYVERNMANREDIYEIINLAKAGEIDISQYLDDSKTKATAFDSIIDEKVDRSDKKHMNRIYNALEKLRLNIAEFNSYIEFTPLFDDFKEEYEKLIPKEDAKKEEYKGLKTILDQIENKESDLEKLNRKIFSGRPGFFEFKNDNDLKQLKIESVSKAKDLYELYQTYDKEYFKAKVLSILNKNMTISDLLNLYYSFDYFKKLAIQRVYNTTDYEQITKVSDSFDLFAMDPTTIIVDGLPVFEETNIPKIIANKYKLNNLKLTEEDLDPNSLQILENKVLLLLRINKIENSSTTVDKIWFIVQVEKMMAKENKKEQL